MGRNLIGELRTANNLFYRYLHAVHNGLIWSKWQAYKADRNLLIFRLIGAVPFRKECKRFIFSVSAQSKSCQSVVSLGISIAFFGILIELAGLCSFDKIGIELKYILRMF